MSLCGAHYPAKARCVSVYLCACVSVCAVCLCAIGILIVGSIVGRMVCVSVCEGGGGGAWKGRDF